VSPRSPLDAIKSIKEVGDVLLGLRLLTAEQYELARKEAETGVARFEDVVIDMGAVTEADLLKALAAHHKTRFVTAQKLAKAEIDRATLTMVPRGAAEAFGVFPVIFDAEARVLSVVTGDPADAGVLREIAQVSGAKEVRAFVARPAAVRAAIAKAYGGDIHAFDVLDRAAQQQFQAMLDVYERNLVSDVSMATTLAREGARRERVVDERDLVRAGTQAPAAPRDPAGAESMLEVMNVMISLLENSRQELRGHSSLVARLTRRLVERIDLPKASAAACVAAGFLHDVGKMGQYHLTALNCSEYEGHKLAAQKACGTPARLFSAAELARETTDAIGQMYERYDGKGFPGGIQGKDIPLGARVLAIVDTYSDLTENPRNPFRKKLSTTEACDVLAKYKGSIFDPHLVDLFKVVVSGDDVRARLLANRYVAVLVESDAEESTVLELRMLEQGFDVKIARSAENALKLLAEVEADLVVSELDLPVADGLALLTEARKHAWGKELPWVVHTRRQGRIDAQRAFDLGVLDFVAKPAPTDVLVAKLKALLDQRAARKRARGVSGSLREMSLPDIVQVLYHGRKSGNLRIRGAGESGEIHVSEGNVTNALFGALRGEEAFYAMVKLKDGEFGLDPDFRSDVRVIHQTSEALLLEGMRRMDEGIS